MPNTKRKAIAQIGVEAHDDPDFLLCLDYIKWVEWDRKDKAGFADKHQVDRSTVWQWQIKWTENGLMAKARQYLGAVIIDDVIVTNRRIAADWNKMADQLTKMIFKDGISDFTRLQAIIFAYEKIVQPVVENQQESSNPEVVFLEKLSRSKKSLDPMSIAAGNEQGDDEEL